MSQDNLVSVVLPTRNRAPSLRRAIYSVLSQSYRRLELIVVDDASTDGTASSIRSIEDPRLRLVRLDTPAGAAAARNEGAGRARGRYLAFQDSDDVWRPDKLARQVPWMERRAVVACVCSCRLHKRGRVHPIAHRPGVLPGDTVIERLLGGASYSTQTLVVDRSVFDDVGGFDAGLPRRQDFDLCLRLALRGAFAFEKTVGVDLYYGEDSISANARAFETATLRIIESHPSIFEAHRRGHGIQLYKTAKHLALAGEGRAALAHTMRSLRVDPLNWRTQRLALLLLSGTLPIARMLRR